MNHCKFILCRDSQHSHSHQTDDSDDEELALPTDQQPSFNSTREEAAAKTALSLSEILDIAALAVVLRKGPNLLPSQDECATVRKKTLVLDLDETLVHSSYFAMPNHAFKLRIVTDSILHEVYVAKRPHLDKFLESCSKLYEVVGFTASNQLYADLVFDALDPLNKYFAHRLYRDSCLQYKNFYIKDLARLGRSLRKTVIVDNCSISAALQPNNLIKIDPWYMDARDRKLIIAFKLLKELAKTSNVQRFLGQESFYLAN